jgi:hypothetical protein
MVPMAKAVLLGIRATALRMVLMVRTDLQAIKEIALLTVLMYRIVLPQLARMPISLCKIRKKLHVLPLDTKGTVLPMAPTVRTGPPLVIKGTVLLMDLMVRADHPPAIREIVLPMAPTVRTGPPLAIRETVLPMALMDRTDLPPDIKGPDLPITTEELLALVGIRVLDLLMLVLAAHVLRIVDPAVQDLRMLVLVAHVLPIMALAVLDLHIKEDVLVVSAAREDQELEAREGMLLIRLILWLRRPLKKSLKRKRMTLRSLRGILNVISKSNGRIPIV